LLCIHANFGDIQSGFYSLKSAVSPGYIDSKYYHSKFRKAVGSGKDYGGFYDFKITAEAWNYKAEFHHARCIESAHKIENLKESKEAFKITLYKSSSKIRSNQEI
jgi:hypothetical protein